MTTSHLTEISEGVHFFQPPPDRIAGWRRSANVVILVSSQKLFLIDSGGPSVRNHITSIVHTFLTEGQRDVHCIHTHGHIDHMAGASQIQNAFGAEIWAHEEAVPFVMKQSPIFLEKEHNSLIVSFRELFTAPSWFVRGAMRATLGRTRSLTHVGEIGYFPHLDDIGFHPVALPGHHFGHTGFFSDELGLLIAGDLIDPRHRMKPILTAPSSDFDAMRLALKRVQDLSPSTMIPGHGTVIHGEDSIQRSIEESLDTLETAMEAVIEILEEGPATLPELSSRMQRKGIGPGDVFRRMFIHSILKHLLRIGKASRHSTPRKNTIFSLQ